jgi:osmotically-inducible protein OsmY
MAQDRSSGRRVSDEDIYKQVVTAINKLTFVRESQPQVEVLVADGVVAVKGIVISEVIRKAVLWAASTAPGVKEVIDALHTDTELRVMVGRALTADPALTERRIFVTAYQGVITLAGQVASDEERQAAAKAAAQIEGVRSVTTNLMVTA